MYIDEISRDIGISLSGVSLISSMLFIIIFFCNSKNYSNLSLKLILFVQISDALFALGIILILNIDKEQYWCKLQAFILQFGSLCSIFCRLAITIVMYLALKRNEICFKTLEAIVFLTVGIMSLFLSAVYFLYI